MKARLISTLIIGLLVYPLQAGTEARLQQNTAQTELPGKGPCTNVPARYNRIEERLAWFYGCMHRNPPTIAEIKAKFNNLSPEKQALMKPYDFATMEALIGTADNDLPIQVFPKQIK